MYKLKNIFKNKAFLTVFLSGIVFIIVFLLPKFFIILDKKISYYFIQNHNQSLSVSDDIIMVNIDDKSIAKIDTFPFSRDVYADVISILSEKNVAVIAFDIILSDNSPFPEYDKQLSYEILKSGKVVLGAPITDNGRISIVPPIDQFLVGNTNFGFFTPKLNEFTGEVYSFIPTKNLNIKVEPIDGKCYGEKVKEADLNKKVCNTDKEFNYFALEILKKYYKSKSIIRNATGINLGNIIDIPFSKLNSNEILINYIPRYKNNKITSNKNFTEISLSDIYNKEGQFNEIDFENKIVLIGATAEGLKDEFRTPNGVDFGVYVHGNIINTILSGNFLIYFNENLEWFLILLSIIILIYLNLSKNNNIVLYGNISFLIIFFTILYGLLCLDIGVILNHPAYLVFAFILSITFSNIAKYLIENKDKKKMLKALGEYISKDVAQKILNTNDGIKLEGEKKEISIFFSDIAGFTSISENFDATELVIFLREYLGEMSHIIMDEKGFINKYEGDAIMALWGVFGYENTSNYDNCKTALLQQQALNKLNLIWKEKYNQVLSVRMGLHYGEAIVGNIGALGRKMEFTALGDNVNLASRLEGVNKFYNTNICVSDSIYEDQKENFEFRKLDKIRVKGKQNFITIYELLGFKDKISDLQKDIRIGFEKALDLYFIGEFEKAGKMFKKLGDLGDKPSLVFNRRCLRFEITPPKDDWGGVWDMEEK